MQDADSLDSVIAVPTPHMTEVPSNICMFGPSPVACNILVTTPPPALMPSYDDPSLCDAVALACP